MDENAPLQNSLPVLEPGNSVQKGKLILKISHFCLTVKKTGETRWKLPQDALISKEFESSHDIRRTCTKVTWDLKMWFPTSWNREKFGATVDGRNPANQLISSLSHYSQGLVHPRWCRISSINSMMPWNRVGSPSTPFGSAGQTHWSHHRRHRKQPSFRTLECQLPPSAPGWNFGTLWYLCRMF